MGPPLDFFDEESVGNTMAKNESLTLVVGADLVYTREIAIALPRVFKQLLESVPFAIYAHTFGRYDFLDNIFLEHLEQNGLKVKEMCGEDDSLREVEQVTEGAEEMEEFDLFPQQKVRILKIFNAREID